MTTTAGAILGPLTGRRRELGWLAQMAVEAASGRSAALVVVGEAGIGKTALFDALASEATASVARTRGVETGDAPAYSGVAQLCGTLRKHAGALSPEQAGVLAGALGWGPPMAVDRAAVGAALVALLGAAARGRGLVAIVDDAGSLDSASLETLKFAVARLGTEGVVLLFGARPGEEAGVLAGLDRMALGGLDQRAARELLTLRAASPVDATVADRLVAATGGNPLALAELAAVLSPDQLGGRQPMPRPLPVGDHLRNAYEEPLAALAPSARQALLAVAASFGRIDVLAAGLDRLGLNLADLEEAAQSSGLVVVEEEVVDFSYPLARSAVYASASDEDRRGVHQALAEANAEAGELERQAWHLARATTTPDEDVAAIVEASAQRIRALGGIAEAAAGFEAAAQLSPEPDLRIDRLLSAGELWLLAGRVAAARAIAEDVIGRAPAEELRARAVLLRGLTLLFGSSEVAGRQYLREELERAAKADRAVAVAMVVAISASALRSGEITGALDAAAEARDRAADTDARTRTLAELWWAASRVAAGDRGPRRWLIEQVGEQVSAGLRTEAVLVLVTAGLSLVWAGELDAARVALEKLERAARAAVASGALPAILSTRALLEHRRSRWVAAEAAATEALELATQTDQVALIPYASAMLATVEAVFGRAEECRRRCLSLLDTPARRLPVVRTAVLSALGLLELGEDRPAEAVRWLEVLAGSEASPARASPGVVLWGAELAEAYVRVGQQDKAAAVVDQLEERAAATADARAMAAVKRCRAMLAADDVQAEALFADALRHYGGPDWRFARGRIELARGTRLGRAGRVAEADPRLRTARSLFAGLGARGWETQAEKELRRLGLIPPEQAGAPVSLSPFEQKVAMAAALGGKPSDIAAGLFLSEATVAAHLESVAAKLGVSSAGELQDLVGLLGALEATRSDLDAASAAAGQTSDAPARVRLLGGFDLTLGGRVVEVPAGLVAQALKQVALTGRLPVEELVEELWPDAPPGAGRNRFRSLLTRLRQAVGPVLVRDHEWVALAAGVEIDVRRFEEAAAEAQAAASAGDPRAGQLAARALALYGGELLPGDRHLTFTAGARERLRRRYLAMVTAAVDDAVAKGDFEQGVRLLEDAIAAQPYDEDFYLRAASLLADAGRTSEAAAMMRLARAMMSQLGLPLSPRAADIDRILRG